MELKVIAYARNGHTDKFGIPRQSRDESPIVTRIVFEPEYGVKEALRGIEGFSHLWLIWGFSEISRYREIEISKEEKVETDDARGWSPTVRPPRLGGNKRVGVFATRSPFRPNPIGLSSVRLLGIQHSAVSHQIELLVSGADMMDGTPIYDIKPYLSFSDSHPEAQNGFAEVSKNRTLPVVFCIGDSLVSLSYQSRTTLEKEIFYILSQDPRPGYQDDPDRDYKLDYAGYTVTFHVRDEAVTVTKIEKTVQKDQ